MHSSKLTILDFGSKSIKVIALSPIFLQTHAEGARSRAREHARAGGRCDQPGPCIVEQMVRDTVGLMEGPAIDRAHVFEGSMGGMIAQPNGIGSNPEAFLPQAGP